MVVKEEYKFKDGRVGIRTHSDKFYKTIEVEEPTENNGEIELKKVYKDIYYKIRKVGTDEIYEEAIDILNFEYEEVSQAEMEAEYGSSQ